MTVIAIQCNLYVHKMRKRTCKVLKLWRFDQASESRPRAKVTHRKTCSFAFHPNPTRLHPLMLASNSSEAQTLAPEMNSSFELDWQRLQRMLTPVYVRWHGGRGNGYGVQAQA